MSLDKFGVQGLASAFITPHLKHFAKTGQITDKQEMLAEIKRNLDSQFTVSNYNALSDLFTIGNWVIANVKG